jgi:hypothetical protein
LTFFSFFCCCLVADCPPDRDFAIPILNLPPLHGRYGLQVDGHFFKVAGECVRRLVSRTDRRARIHADVECFVGGEAARDGLVHAPFANFLVVDVKRDVAALSHATGAQSRLDFRRIVRIGVVMGWPSQSRPLKGSPRDLRGFGSCERQVRRREPTEPEYVNPEPSETTPRPGAAVRTRAVTRHSGGAASVGALAMGAVVLGALTVGTIAMRRTRILSDRAEHPEPTTPTPVVSVRTRAVTRHSGGAASLGALAMGAMALGAMAVGTIAIRRLAIGNLALKRGRARELHIGWLQIDELMIGRIVRHDDAGGGRG